MKYIILNEQADEKSGKKTYYYRIIIIVNYFY